MQHTRSHRASALSLQRLQMMRQMLADQRRHKIVAMIVAPVRRIVQRHTRIAAHLHQALRQQLTLLQERVRSALIDEQPQPLDRCQIGGHFSGGANQLSGVPSAPSLTRFVGAQIPGQRFLAPRALHRIGDGRQSRSGPIQTGIAQRTNQRTVTAHAVTGDALAAGNDRQLGGAQRNQFDGDVAVHAIVVGPRRLRGVHIETGAGAEIPAVVFAGQVEATRRCVRADEDETELGGVSGRLGGDQFLKTLHYITFLTIVMKTV